MTDASGVVPAVEGDRASRPWVKRRRYGLDGVYTLQRSLPLLPWYMGGVDHVHHLDVRREGFLASTVRPAGLLIVLASGAFALVFNCELAGLFYNPTVTVGVVG